ncbi:MAG: hypothetical protein KAT16_05865 [Candidatus Heimdallarchaeota archaeon]|nr:hypothetical protein [Candidatus Heimdallarchaeota archaeon]
MIPINNEEIEQVWQNLVYSPKQVKNYNLELTLKTIHSFESGGQIDFGGGEYQEAKQQEIVPKLEKDPKYGWWNLKKGNYLVTYNEIIDKPKFLALISPHARILRTGVFHPTFIWLSEEKRQKIVTILQVGENGLRVKENARISTAMTFKIS